MLCPRLWPATYESWVDSSNPSAFPDFHEWLRSDRGRAARDDMTVALDLPDLPDGPVSNNAAEMLRRFNCPVPSPSDADLPKGVVHWSHWQVINAVAELSSQQPSDLLEQWEEQAPSQEEVSHMLVRDWLLSCAHSNNDNGWTLMTWADAAKWAKTLPCTSSCSR